MLGIFSYTGILYLSFFCFKIVLYLSVLGIRRSPSRQNWWRKMAWPRWLVSCNLIICCFICCYFIFYISFFVILNLRGNPVTGLKKIFRNNKWINIGVTSFSILNSGIRWIQNFSCRDPKYRGTAQSVGMHQMFGLF